MINLAVFFGGESCEHDISIITGLQLISKVNEYLYNVIPIYITKSGEWITGENLKDLDNFPDNLGKTKNIGLIAGDASLYIKNKNKLKKYLTIDIAILCLHGINGEDGSVASILNLSKVPYSSCDIFSSAICMDKIIFNDLCRGLDLPKVSYLSIIKDDYNENSDDVVNIIKKFDFPIIIKPSRQGSSIGIKICKSEENLANDLEECFKYDERLLIERYINLKKEVNIACFRNKGELMFSKTEEPISKTDFLDFNEKYSSNLSGMESMKRISPANISSEIESKIKTIAHFLYTELDMFGVVRFDFMIDKEDNVYINEVNTIPGSMANYLFGEKYPYTKLIEDMISNALIRFDNKSKLQRNYNSNVLKQGFNGFKK